MSASFTHLTVSRAAWIDVGLGAVTIGLTAAVGTISAYLAPAGWRMTLYALCAAIAVVAVAQTVRGVRGALHHERTFAELREGQEYLAQPEVYRQWDTIFQHHAALAEADDLFRANFEIDSREVGATVVRCKACGWQVQKALLYAREDAVQHLRADHAPPPQRRRFRLWPQRHRVNSTT